MLLNEIRKNAGLLNEESNFIPGASIKEDEKARKILKFLFLVKDEEATKLLYRINLIRKSEKLSPLTKEEILSKSLKQDIKDQKKEIEKLKKEGGNNKTKLEKIVTKLLVKPNPLKIIARWGFQISKLDKDSSGIKNDISNASLFNELMSLNDEVDKVEKVAICESMDKKFLICCVETSSSNSYQLKVLGNAPSHKIVGLQVRFPELKKKILCFPNSDFDQWKIRKL